MSTSGHSTSLDDLFYQAIALDPEARKEFVANVRPNQLRRELVELLKADQQIEDSNLFTFDTERKTNLDSTIDSRRRSTGTSAAVPQRFGRYNIVSRLGKGAFGSVFLAHDPDLDRNVALKVPNEDFFARGITIEAFIAEARSVARIDHSALVSVYDVQLDGDQVFIVQQYIDGGSLDQWIGSNSISPATAVDRTIEICEAVGVLHQHGLVHRDLKPNNILVDKQERLYIADFGLALHESVRWEQKGTISGTPAYMSPEQVRGETHLVDGRADVWAIGVIFYEMMLGTLPFRAESSHLLFDLIKASDPTPPRQIKPGISSQLQRICLKCLEKKRSDRYQSTADLVDDLRHWQANASQSTNSKATPRNATSMDSSLSNVDDTGATIAVVPKGLRSFNANDADFFTSLLPGPYDRDGLPESIRFWKTRIEQAEDAFRVGLIYGPTGCGKSSLVKAGLLPRLENHVSSIYIEATQDRTEEQLNQRLANLISKPSTKETLVSNIRQLRNSNQEERKTLLVIDQFEQWLHGNGSSRQLLVDALRQCDGDRVQCLLMVRDDFWMAAARFMHELEIPLIEDHNCQAVDLFSLKHGRRILTYFGMSTGDIDDPPIAAQTKFVEKAIAKLAIDDKIISIRLALFAQMMRGKTWAADQLIPINELGVDFLEATFSSPSSQPEHRLHQAAIRRILAALLPSANASIKGSVRTIDELASIAGYSRRPRDMKRVIGILDRELRILTPVDQLTEGPDVDAEFDSAVDESQARYQLAHDYLVPALRDWLTQKQRESRQGRAELKLQECFEAWERNPTTKFLPSLGETFQILLFSRRRRWDRQQFKMMTRARWHYGSRLAIFIALATATIGIGVRYRHALAEEQSLRAKVLENGRQARTLVRNSISTWLTGPFDDLKGIPGFEQPLIQVLDEAALQYAKLAETSRQEPAIQMELAQIKMRKAIVFELLEKWSEAFGTFTEAHEILSKMQKKSADSEAVVINLSVCDLKRGKIHKRQGRPHEAKQLYDVASSRLQDRVNSLQESNVLWHTLGMLEFYQAEMMQVPTEKEAALRESLRLYEMSHAAAPDQIESLRGIIAAQLELQRWLLEQRRIAEARELAVASIRLSDTIVSSQENALLGYELRGDASLNLALMAKASLEPETEASAYRDALQNYDLLLGEAPQTRHYRRRYAIAQMNLAEFQHRQGETKSAEQNLLLAGQVFDELAATSQTSSKRDHELVAICYDRMGHVNIDLANTEQALDFLRMAIQHFTSLLEEADSEVYRERLSFAHFHFALASYQKEAATEAKEHFEKATRILEELIAKNNRLSAHRIRFHLARIYSHWAELQESNVNSPSAVENALNFWNLLEENRPTPEQLEGFARFLVNCRQESQRDPERALMVANRIETSEVPNRDHLALLGAVHSALGNAAIAKEHLTQVSEWGDGLNLLYLAMSQHALGEVDPAGVSFQKAMKRMQQSRPGNLVVQRLFVQAQQQLSGDQ